MDRGGDGTAKCNKHSTPEPRVPPFHWLIISSNLYLLLDGRANPG